MWMVVGEFLFLVTKNLKSRRLDLLSHHEIWFQNFSFSSRNWRKLQISRLFFAKILVLFSNQKTDLDISLFSSRNSRYGFHISLSLLDFTFWHLVNAWREWYQESDFLDQLFVLDLKIPVVIRLDELVYTWNCPLSVFIFQESVFCKPLCFLCAVDTFSLGCFGVVTVCPYWGFNGSTDFLLIL